MGKIKVSRGLIIILVIGLGLRLVNLGQSFWLDEATQAQLSSWPVSQIWSARQNDFHPPLFYILAHFWLILGKSEIWLRLPSVIFGVINIWLVYLFARKLFSGDSIKFIKWKINLGFWAGLLLAINPFHIYYSQEFRSYSLLCLLGTLAMYLLYNQNFFWLAIINSLLLYTHYSSVFLIITQLIFVAIYNRKLLRPFLISLLFSVILYIPWIPQFYSQLGGGINIDTYLPGWRQILSVSPLKALPLTLFKLIAGRINFLNLELYYLYILFVFVVVFFAFRWAVSQRHFLFTWCFTPIILMVLVSFIFPQNQPFRVIYILPALILVFSRAAVRFPKLFITLFIYIALVGNLAYFTRPRLQREQWRQALEFVSANTESFQPVVVKFSDRFSPMAWYAPHLNVIAAVPRFPAEPNDVAVRISPVIASQPSSVYLFDYLGEITDPRHEVETALVNMGYTRQKTYDYPGVGFIHLYQRI